MMSILNKDKYFYVYSLANASLNGDRCTDRQLYPGKPIHWENLFLWQIFDPDTQIRFPSLLVTHQPDRKAGTVLVPGLDCGRVCQVALCLERQLQVARCCQHMWLAMS